MKTNKTLIVLMFLVLAQFGFGQKTSDFFSKADAFFSTYVSNGRVAYSEIKANPASLDELLAIAKEIRVTKDDAKTYQAFWINGYNLSVIKGIVDNYPIKSPLDKAGFFDKKTYDIGGEKTTLNDIENKLLRAVFPQESRFHFVLVCAGLGCPPIIDAAYTPAKLEGQLQTQTQLALNNPNFIRVKGKKVNLSQIFEWYTGDFTQGGKNLIEYVNQYRNEKLDPKAKVGYYSYDWALNETK
ncbi:DUF547 domain-containing protein [Flagellimonas meridianipacifica]|uniref:Uncharacterized protein DUF547 n=1 Tax=Flagellimonas meridianipacifica TaxID=1080225 RepID=A0A2T0MFQ8_9FLAO|nr:DUF547 domain-containing protein [Allomuricauda pacifica]PRX56417.1 uncharacterized protein DUF547 [Allomuricauda pacifica]